MVLLEVLQHRNAGVGDLLDVGHFVVLGDVDPADGAGKQGEGALEETHHRQQPRFPPPIQPIDKATEFEAPTRV